MQTNSEGKYICLFFSPNKIWILRELDERRQTNGLSRTQVLEDLLGAAKPRGRTGRKYALGA
jgi:hypothetical protein